MKIWILAERQDKVSTFSQSLLTPKPVNLHPFIVLGACSTVNIASHKRTGAKYAVKMFNAYDTHQTKQLLKEMTVLAMVGADSQALYPL